MYKINQYFYNKFENNVFLLAQIDYGVIALISLSSGNRFSKSTKCENIFSITKEELKKIIGPMRMKDMQIFSRKEAFDFLENISPEK